jgi:hypothetical protein
MARYKNGINGAFSGKVGTVVGSSYRGIAYMRSLPETTKPPTEKQLHQRLKFSVITAWLRPILALINIGFQILTGDKNAMNRAVSYHMKEALIDNGQDVEIDFKKAIFSRGELLVSWILEVLTLVSAVLNIKWDNGPESAFDKASFIIYNPQKEKFVTFKDAAQRQDKETVLQLPKRFAGDTVHAWMQYTNEAGNMVSTSVYLGQIVVV